MRYTGLLAAILGFTISVARADGCTPDEGCCIVDYDPVTGAPFCAAQGVCGPYVLLLPFLSFASRETR